MLNWGVVGTGNIAKSFAVSLQDSQESQLIGVAGSSKKKAEEFAKTFKCRFFADYQNLLEQKAIQAVYIATPHTSHFDLSLLALEKGKSVLCEKPITMNSTEAMILIDAARKNKVLLMEAFMYKVHPQTLKVKKILKENFSDKPVYIEASFGFEAKVNDSHRLVNPTLGGGSILDVGCYPMSMSRMIAGIQEGRSFLNPIEIKAEGRLSSEGIDLFAQAELIFSNDSKALISSSIDKELDNTVLISDGQQSLFVKEPWLCGEYNKRQSEIIFTNKERAETAITFKQKKGIFTHEIDHFTNILKSKKIESNLVSQADSHGNMIWLDTWRKRIKVRYVQDNPEKRVNSLLYYSKRKKNLFIPFAKLKGLHKKISRLVLGCDNQSDLNHAFAMFDHFFSYGGRVFDTAFIYNNGKSDEYLGSWMKNRGVRDQVAILGKGAHTPLCNPETIRTQLKESLEKLQTNNLDIYCLHRDNLDIPVNEFVDVLDELKDEGLITIKGASNWSLDRFIAAQDYSHKKGKEGFGVISNNFSLAKMNAPVWPGCESCSDENFKEYLVNNQIAVFPWSSQGRGFFLDSKEFDSSLHVSDPTDEERERVWGSDDNYERRRRCFYLAKKKGVEAIQLALAYVLHQNFPCFPLIGSRNFYETESSLGALEVSLNREDLQWLDLEKD